MADGRSERWAHHRASERYRIVDVAKEAIEEVGPALTMNDIATRADVPKPTLYRFFSDKSDLMSAVADRARDDVIAELQRTSQAPPATYGEMLLAALRGYASLVAAHPNLSRYLFFGNDSRGPYTMQNSRAVALQVEPLLSMAFSAAGCEDPDVSLDASLIVGTVTGAASWWLDHSPAMSVDDFVARVAPVVSAVVVAAADRLGAGIGLQSPVSVDWAAMSEDESSAL
ncbi:MAG: TetR/AcrR family transcriptional regulator [Rhodococcus sp. (in: high G+C Gram-positive bacteria)]